MSGRHATDTAMVDERQRKANLKLALVLATVALAFAVGIVAKFVLFGAG
jgi:hypothetical protein